MIVTNIVSRNKTKADIYLDGEIAFVLYKGDFKKNPIKIGDELWEEVYLEITMELSQKRGLERSLHLLTNKDYTEKQIRQKLSDDGYTDAVIDVTIQRLKEERFLDDRK